MDPLDLPPEKYIDLKTSNFFPPFARLGAIIIAVLGLSLVFSNIIVALLFVVSGAFVATSHYRLKVDFNRETFIDYSWIFGFRFGDKERFERIEYIFINKNKVRQTVPARVASSTYDRYDYNAYLKFSEKQKVHLVSNADKTIVIRRAQFIAAKLHCQVKDISED